jgi:toxin-antitoxin system PIN domain toxin
VILVDANVLIYAVDADLPHHTLARRWLERTLSSATEVGLPWTVILAFVRITTHAAVMRKPLAPEAALAYVDDWLAQPYVTAVVPGEHHWAILKTLLEATGSAGNLTSDAHLAALAIEHNAAVCSTDNDFRRFPGVRLINPILP